MVVAHGVIAVLSAAWLSRGENALAELLHLLVARAVRAVPAQDPGRRSRRRSARGAGRRPMRGSWPRSSGGEVHRSARPLTLVDLSFRRKT